MLPPHAPCVAQANATAATNVTASGNQTAAANVTDNASAAANVAAPGNETAAANVTDNATAAADVAAPGDAEAGVNETDNSTLLDGDDEAAEDPPATTTPAPPACAPLGSNGSNSSGLPPCAPGNVIQLADPDGPDARVTVTVWSIAGFFIASFAGMVYRLGPPLPAPLRKLLGAKASSRAVLQHGEVHYENDDASDDEATKEVAAQLKRHVSGSSRSRTHRSGSSADDATERGAASRGPSAASATPSDAAGERGGGARGGHAAEMRQELSMVREGTFEGDGAAADKGGGRRRGR